MEWNSFRWTRRCCCCGPITSSLLIFLVNIVTHISLLSISCLVLNSPDELFGSIVDAIDTRDKLLAQSQIYLEIHGSILAVSEGLSSLQQTIVILYYDKHNQLCSFLESCSLLFDPHHPEPYSSHLQPNCNLWRSLSRPPSSVTMAHFSLHQYSQHPLPPCVHPCHPPEYLVQGHSIPCGYSSRSDCYLLLVSHIQAIQKNKDSTEKTYSQTSKDPTDCPAI